MAIYRWGEEDGILLCRINTRQIWGLCLCSEEPLLVPDVHWWSSYLGYAKKWKLIDTVTLKTFFFFCTLFVSLKHVMEIQTQVFVGKDDAKIIC